MATSITPKSELRKVTSISKGYGEVPVVEVDGKQGWGLPGRRITYCIDEAMAMAARLDADIRNRLQRYPRQMV